MSRLSENVLVIGLGSPIMTDDAIGLRVAGAVEDMRLPNVETRQEAIGGLDIIPVISGYRNVVIVDAIRTCMYDPGTVIIFDPKDFEPTVTNASAHEMNLATALKIGKLMDPENMPESVVFVGIEVQDIMTVSEKMTEKVEDALPDAVGTVLDLIKKIQMSI